MSSRNKNYGLSQIGIDPRISSVFRIGHYFGAEFRIRLEREIILAVKRKIFVVGILIMFVLSVCGGCDKIFAKKEVSDAKSRAAASARPIAAAMDHPVQRQIIDYEEFTGRLMPFDEVDVKAQVDGTLMECTFKKDGKMKISPQTGEPVKPASTETPLPSPINKNEPLNKNEPGSDKIRSVSYTDYGDGAKLKFYEGSEVREGDLLFVINPELYEAELVAAKGDLKVLEARKKRLESEFKRSEELLPSSAVSRQDYDLALANLQECDGEIAIARAKILKAQINVNYTRIYAPIDGYVCNSKVSIGNLIQSNSTSLVRIVKIDPIFLYFYIDESTVLRLKEIADARKNANSAQIIEPVIEFRLSDELEFNHQAKIDYMTPAMDQATGTRLVRAVSRNPKSVSGERPFHPGMTVHLRISVSEKYNALLVPEKCLGMNQSTHFVYVLGKEGKPEMRVVTLGPLQGDNWRVIRKGLKSDDLVITDNLMRLRLDRPVIRSNAPSQASSVSRQDGDIKFTPEKTEIPDSAKKKQ